MQPGSACVQAFTDAQQFKAAVLPMLQADPTLNTLCLSELTSIKEHEAGCFMATVHCSSCSGAGSCAALSAGLKATGWAQLYVSPTVCSHTAVALIQQLQQLPQLHRTINTGAAAADLIMRAAQQHAPPSCCWRVKQRLTLMAAAPAPAAVGMPASAEALCPGASTPALRLRQCGDADAALVQRWSSEFLIEVFALQRPPAAADVSAMVAPRLQQGLYFCLEFGKQGQQQQPQQEAVCMVGFVPTTSSSARITMVFTPVEARGRGYARAAVRELCRLLASNYRQLCLLADTANPTACHLYETCGFAPAGEMVILSRSEPGDLEAAAVAAAIPTAATAAAPAGTGSA